MVGYQAVQNHFSNILTSNPYLYVIIYHMDI